MAVSQSFLARKWAVNKSTVNRYCKAGMTLESEASAESWRLSHIQNAKGLPRRPSRPKNDTTATLEVPALEEVLADENKITNLSRSDLLAMRNEIRASRKMASQMSKKMATENQHEESRKYAQTLSHTITRQLLIEREVRRLNEIDGITISLQDARSMMLEHVFQVKSLMDAAPANLASHLNPESPELARTLLEEFRDNLYKVLRESRFKNESIKSKIMDGSNVVFPTAPEGEHFHPNP